MISAEILTFVLIFAIRIEISVEPSEPKRKNGGSDHFLTTNLHFDLVTI